jgi:hypothetical protein
VLGLVVGSAVGVAVAVAVGVGVGSAAAAIPGSATSANAEPSTNAAAIRMAARVAGCSCRAGDCIVRPS